MPSSYRIFAMVRELALLVVASSGKHDAVQGDILDDSFIDDLVSVFPGVSTASLEPGALFLCCTCFRVIPLGKEKSKCLQSFVSKTLRKKGPANSSVSQQHCQFSGVDFGNGVTYPWPCPLRNVA